ncbi:MAG: Coenzyme F420 hydrogenase/dehydrogenase, beta subunit C-terminal domain [Thermofilum sp.]|nr:Coenzyme F420 hydrogenase/dehydrogenase, beta subunit C-terminal domain [Thermofilum sp.]
MSTPDKIVRSLIGNYSAVYIAWATDERIRRRGASGGVGTALLRYLLEHHRVDAVVVPRQRVNRGFVYGVWTVVRQGEELERFSGSLYAPTFGFAKVFDLALRRFGRIAVTAVPCYVEAARRLARLRGREHAVFILGPYCNNTPNVYAVRYALKRFHISAYEVVSISFRGYGWPGFTSIWTSGGVVRISFPIFWDSGFGHYFYGRSCFVCTNPTNVGADLSLADPWTLPAREREPFMKLGGATLVVVRSEKGLNLLREASEAGYLVLREVDPIFALPDSVLIKSTARVFADVKNGISLSPGVFTILREAAYVFGRALALREGAWPLLSFYHRGVGWLLSLALLVDEGLGTRWGRVRRGIRRLQSAKGQEVVRMLK